MFGWKSKKNPWADVDYMTLVPTHRLAWQEDPDSDAVLVQMPRYGDPIFGRLLQPRLSEAKKYITVPLEARGTFLWRMMDGQRTVADLVQAFEEQHPEDDENAAKRISMYLHAMYDNKFINYLNLST